MILGTDRLERYRACVAGTVRWAYHNGDRALAEPDLQAHYKGLYFAASVGDMVLAARYAGIVRRLMRADGDFRTEEQFKGFRQFPCSPPNQYIYPNGWIIAGAQRLGVYDIARVGLGFIEPFQDPAHGGFYYTFDPAAGRIDRGLMDSSSTSSAGLALLACGRLEQAMRAGDFILRLLDAQSEPDRYFFSCMKPDGTLETDVFAGEDKWDPNGRKQKCLSAEADAGAELTWLIGKPTKFLTRLATATGEQRYLRGARAGFDFFHRLQENAWTNYASCKTMWAGAELYRLTGEARFAETAIRILDFFADSQLPSGGWVHHLWYADESDQPFPATADITLEFGGEISDAIFDLCQ